MEKNRSQFPFTTALRSNRLTSHDHNNKNKHYDLAERRAVWCALCSGYRTRAQKTAEEKPKNSNLVSVPIGWILLVFIAVWCAYNIMVTNFHVSLGAHIFLCCCLHSLALAITLPLSSLSARPCAMPLYITARPCTPEINYRKVEKQKRPTDAFTDCN